jgi:hypothetical protein
MRRLSAPDHKVRLPSSNQCVDLLERFRELVSDHCPIIIDDNNNIYRGP